MSDRYHNRVLELAANIPNVGRLESADGSAHKVSRICGSEMTVDLARDHETGVITAIAVDPKACALAQASAAVLFDNAISARSDEVVAARDALKAMLKEGGAPGRAIWRVASSLRRCQLPPTPSECASGV